MKYITFTKYNNYFTWQLNILVESFIQKNLIDDLTIILHPTTTSPPLNKKLQQCKNIYLINQQSQYHILYNLIINNKIHFPFTILQPDTLIYNPPPSPQINSITHSLDNYNNPNLENKIDKNIKIWKYIGDTITINTNIEFIKRITQWTNVLNDKEAFIMTCLENIYMLKPNPNYEMQLYEIGNANFIRYNKGIKPSFFKTNFNHDNITLSNNILQSLSESNSTNTSQFFLKIVTSLYQNNIENISI